MPIILSLLNQQLSLNDCIAKKNGYVNFVYAKGGR